MKKDLRHALRVIMKGMTYERERFIDRLCEAIDERGYSHCTVDVRSGKNMEDFDSCDCDDNCHTNHHHSPEMHQKILEQLEEVKKSIDALNESVREHVAANTKTK